MYISGLSDIRTQIGTRESGFIIIELMIVIAIILLVATPFARYFYREQINSYERQFFDVLGIGATGQFIILSVLAIMAIYFGFRRDFVEVKRRNKPVVGKTVRMFAIFSLLFVSVILFVSMV